MQQGSPPVMLPAVSNGGSQGAAQPDDVNSSAGAFSASSPSTLSNVPEAMPTRPQGTRMNKPQVATRRFLTAPVRLNEAGRISGNALPTQNQPSKQVCATAPMVKAPPMGPGSCRQGGRQSQTAHGSQSRRLLENVFHALEGTPWHIVCTTEFCGRRGYSVVNSTMHPLPQPLDVPAEAKAVIVICLVKHNRAGQDFIVELLAGMAYLPPIIVMAVSEKGYADLEELFDLQSVFRMCGASDTVLQRSFGVELRLDVAMTVRRAVDMRQEVDAEFDTCIEDHDNHMFWPCAHRIFKRMPKMNNSCSVVPAQGAKIGHYELIEKIGHGIISDVYSAADLQTKTLHAVKVVRKAKLVDLGSVARLSNEMSLLEGLNHPNIMELKDVMHAKRNFYLVMEYAGERNLCSFLKGLPRLDLDVAQNCMKQISGGVVYCHRCCVAHRDLKPENIVVKENGGSTLHLKIVDFGCAAPAAQMCNDVAGTMPFIAPEVILTDSHNPTLADTWACGGVLLELICGIGFISSMLQSPMSPEISRVIGRQIADFFATSRNLQTHVEAKLGNINKDLFVLLWGLLAGVPEERWNAGEMDGCAWLNAVGQPTDNM